MNNLKQLRGRIIALNDYAWKNSACFGADYSGRLDDMLQLNSEATGLIAHIHYDGQAVF